MKFHHVIYYLTYDFRSQFPRFNGWPKKGNENDEEEYL